MLLPKFISFLVMYLLPMHYIGIIFISFVFYIKRANFIVMNDKDNEVFVYTFNIIYVLLIFVFISSALGMGYRYIGFMLPFIAILLSYEVKVIINLKKELWYKSVILVIYILFVSVVFMHNYNLIIMKF